MPCRHVEQHRCLWMLRRAIQSKSLIFLIKTWPTPTHLSQTCSDMVSLYEELNWHLWKYRVRLEILTSINRSLSVSRVRGIKLVGLLCCLNPRHLETLLSWFPSWAGNAKPRPAALSHPRSDTCHTLRYLEHFKLLLRIFLLLKAYFCDCRGNHTPKPEELGPSKTS